MSRRIITSAFRAAGLAAVTVALAACSWLPIHTGQASVVARATYCGTTSQQSAVHYFANRADLAEWIDYRGIRAFGANTVGNHGAIVVEMGQRMTSGYEMTLMTDKTHIDDGTLYLAVKWTAPPHYAAISQAMTSPCMVVTPPDGDYSRIVLVDQLGNTRGSARIY